MSWTAENAEEFFRLGFGRIKRSYPFNPSIRGSVSVKGEAMKKLVVRTAAVLLCLNLSLNAFAQNATVTGTVSDETGALIPGVEVTATNVNTGIVTTRISNEAGAYNFPSLQPGTYNLSASLTGFQTARNNDLRLGQAQEARFNFTLQVGEATTAVDVTSDADLTLATTSASVGDVLPDIEVRSLPMATRNVLDLVQTMAGGMGVECCGGGSGGQGENLGGQRLGETNTSLDGLVMNNSRYNEITSIETAVQASPDLIEEVQVVTGSVDAEGGRGSGQVRLQTRSGSNAFHGALFYTNNNSALKANDWFTNRDGAVKQYENRNQYGGRLGGPIVRNKAFFFVLFEGNRYLKKEATVANMLTPEAQMGFFRFLSDGAPAGQPGAVTRRNGNADIADLARRSVDRNGNILTVDPVDGSRLYMNAIDVFGLGRTLPGVNMVAYAGDPRRTGFDPSGFVQGNFKQMPAAPNNWTVGDGLNTAGFRWNRRIEGEGQSIASSQNSNRDGINARFDYNINDGNKFTFTMSREDGWGMTSQSGYPTFPGSPVGTWVNLPNIYNGSWTATISPTVLNEFRLARKKGFVGQRSPPFVGCCTKAAENELLDDIDPARLALIPNLNGLPLDITVATFSKFVTPVAGAGFRDFTNPTWQLNDTLSWSRGAHSFKTGFQYIANWSDGWSLFNTGIIPTITLSDGNFPVQGMATIANLNANDRTIAENLLKDLSGSVGQVSQGFILNDPKQSAYTDYFTEPRRFRNFRQDDWSLFFKDTWQVTKNLTLNPGLRYDKYGVIYEQNGLAPRAKGGDAGLLGKYGPTAALTTVELVGPKSPNPNLQMYNNDWNNFAPSLGFSYRVPWFGRPTIVRGGYGINYSGAFTAFSVESCCGVTPGTTDTRTINPAAYTNLATLASVLPLTPTTAPLASVPLGNSGAPPNFEMYPDNRPIPYIQNWNLSISRELARDLTLEVAYIGSKSTKLYSPLELNEPNLQASFNGETFLAAFNTTRVGGNSPLFDAMLRGVNFPSVGTVGVGGLTGSDALRRSATSLGGAGAVQIRDAVANGGAAALANILSLTR